MLDMKDFEGVKRIINTNKFDIEFLYTTLLKYEKEIGKISLVENKKIVADVDGKYFIEIYLNSNQIVIQRKIEKEFNEENIDLGNDLKSVDMSIADRMIEQIYDLIINLSKDGIINQPITGVKKVLYVKQEEGKFKNHFYINDKEKNIIYEAKENKLLKEFTINDLKSTRRIAIIKCISSDNGKYTISPNLYTTININKSDSSIKTLFTGEINNKPLTIRADYSDNHYLIELNELVIGAIDSLNSDEKNSYRLEINNLDYEYLIISLCIVIDLNYSNT